MENQPAIITLTGDNGLTVGLMLAVLYLGALLLVQIGKRFAGGQQGQKAA